MENVLKGLFNRYYILVDDWDFIEIVNDLDADRIVSIKRCAFEKGKFIIKIKAPESEWEDIKNRLRWFNLIGRTKETFVATGWNLIFEEL